MKAIKTAPKSATNTGVKARIQDVDPEKMKVTPMQAERLGTMYKIESKSLVGLTIAEISDKFRFQIDPMCLFFRKVCGKVVKTDPTTGTEYPVPFATVYVEDTDCSLLGFFPIGGIWSWFFPFKCHREVIGTTHTDACGNFCAWIPRWDIDWVLRFRQFHICFPIIFERPSLGDILHIKLPEEYVIPIPHGDPEPDPYPELDRARLVRTIEDYAGPSAGRNIDKLISSSSFGANNTALSVALDAPAFGHQFCPPLPKHLQVPAVEHKAAGKLNMDTARSTLAVQLKMDAAEFSGLNLHRYYGPFKRCYNIYFPEWMPFFDVPDITFRVTQDTDGDGDEETIYSEGFGDVRWNSGPISDITLHAMPNALAGLFCGEEAIPCGNEPAILMAGRMPVIGEPTIYDPVSGYALRPNRPHPSGTIPDPVPNTDKATTPFFGTLSLLGCLVPKPGTTATHYRILFEYSSDGGTSYTSPAPFVGKTWPLFRLDLSGKTEWYYPTADSNGWYPIAPPPPHNGPGLTPFMPQNLVFDWNTNTNDNGRYRLTLQMGTPGGSTSQSDPVAFNVDNSYPSGSFTIEWRKAGIGSFQPLTYPCPLIRRGATPSAIEFHVKMDASAAHLRSAVLSAYDCGSGSFTLPAGSITGHWYTVPSDNSVTLDVIYTLPAAAAQGTYGFGGHVSSRAMNPSGWDGGQLLLPTPWEYDPDNIHIDPSFSFSVINAD